MISKFEAGKMSLNQKSGSLKKVILDIGEILKPIYLIKNISFEIEIQLDENDFKIYFDYEKIGQVLNNLMGNAIKFAPEKGLIKIIVRKIPNMLVEIAIYNNGPKVPSDKQKFLFGIYSQLDNAQVQKGTGLGLAISKIIVEAHRGTIGYRDIKNREGCTFFFTPPFRKV